MSSAVANRGKKSSKRKRSGKTREEEEALAATAPAGEREKKKKSKHDTKNKETKGKDREKLKSDAAAATPAVRRTGRAVRQGVTHTFFTDSSDTAQTVSKLYGARYKVISESGAPVAPKHITFDFESSPLEKRDDVMEVGAMSDEADAEDVAAIVTALSAKPDWQHKVADPELTRRYAREAARQGASQASIAAALRRLLAAAAAAADPTGRVGYTLTRPPLKLDKDGYEEEDEDDDYLQDEDIQASGVWRESKVVNKADGATYKTRERSDIQGIGYVDGAVPEELRMRLEAQLDAIANSTEKDFHPGSNEMVQDLIHPSLYPFVRGRSYITTALPVSAAGANKKQGEDDDDYDEAVGDQELGFDAEKEREYNAQAKELQGLDSIYQWLPAEFDVSPEGEVEIVSYINNLNRVRHGALYETIAHAFRLFLPLFAQVLGGGDSRVYGRRLQVIVKAANYLVAPNARYEGSWHVEGMKHERIVASGIYYYSTTPNLPDTCLAFRDQRHNSMADRERSYNTSFNINLGKVDTPAGRCLAFTNSFQHRVKGVENKSSSETGVRKILCFFLIDPDNRVVSSADVPEQQWDEIKPVVTRSLIEASMQHFGRPLPHELMAMIIERAKWGFTKAEAHAHREALMKERKYYIDANNRLWERSFSFCEH